MKKYGNVVNAEFLKIVKISQKSGVGVYNARQKSWEHLGHFFIIHISNHRDQV